MSFRTSIFLSIVLLVAGVVGATIFVVQGILERDARAVLQAELARSSSVFREFQEYRQKQLVSQAQVTAAEPRVKAVVATEDVSHATVIDVANELRAAMGSDLFLMTDGDGLLMADTADPEAEGFDLTGLPLVAAALKDGTATGIWTQESAVYQMAAQRMDFGSVAVGVLIVGYAVNANVAETIERQTGSSVLIAVDDQVSAQAFKQYESLGEESIGALLGHIERDGSEAPQDLTIDGTRYLAVAQPLPGYVGERAVHYVVVRSLDAALAASRQVTQQIYTIAAVALLVSLLLALGLSQVLARPLQGLVAFTRGIAGGKLDSRAKLGGPVELRTLGAAMNGMAEDLQKSRSEIEAINAGLERTVEERTRSLRFAKEEISEMLDNLHDAVFIVDDELNVHGSYSPACQNIFGLGERLGGANVEAFLFGDGAADAEALAQTVFTIKSAMGMPAFQWDLNAPHLVNAVSYDHPTRADAKRRALKIKYAPLFEDDELKRLMFVVSDETEVLALHESVAAEQRKADAKIAALLELISASRAQIAAFLHDNPIRMGRVGESLEAWKRDGASEHISAVFREFHTIKGNARALGLRGISRVAHEVEGVAEPYMQRKQASSPALRDQEHSELLVAKGRLDEILELYDSVARDTILAGDSAASRRADFERLRDRIESIATDPAASSGARELLRSLVSLLEEEADEKVVSVCSLFGQNDAMVTDVSEQLGKQVNFVSRGHGPDLFVVPELGPALRDAFGHAIRNALDHGVESPEDRKQAGKPAAGQVELRVARDSDHYVITVRDDGVGLDADAILAQARKRGLVGASDKPSSSEIYDLLFCSGFSTKASVTDVSGRGVGLDVIRSVLAKLGATAKIVGQPNRGTQLELRIPDKLVRYEEDNGRVAAVKSSAVQRVA